MRKMFKELTSKKEQYDNLIQHIESKLQDSPVGRIRAVNRNGSMEFYLLSEKNDTNGKYLRKENWHVAETIIQRDYNIKVLKCARKWSNWIERIINGMPTERIKDIHIQSRVRQKMINPYELSDEEYVEKWKSVAYTGKEFREDMPVIMTEAGERVRSKTEKMIADKLYMMHIPYRYEYPLCLPGQKVIYPDFTILNVAERKEYILEHFGMMDNPEYADIAVRKINRYAKEGYYAGENILYTFETSRMPIDMIEFGKLMERYILD